MIRIWLLVTALLFASSANAFELGLGNRFGRLGAIPKGKGGGSQNVLTNNGQPITNNGTLVTSG